MSNRLGDSMEKDVIEKDPDYKRGYQAGFSGVIPLASILNNAFTRMTILSFDAFVLGFKRGEKDRHEQFIERTKCE